MIDDDLAGSLSVVWFENGKKYENERLRNLLKCGYCDGSGARHSPSHAYPCPECKGTGFGNPDNGSCNDIFRDSVKP